MSVFLQALVPTSKLAAWYPLDNDDLGTGAIADESGNSRDVGSLGLGAAPVAADQINGRKAVVHNNETDIRSYTGAVGMKELWAIVKVDFTTNFPSTYGGFISGLDNADFALYIGKNSANRWLSTGEGNPFASYYKSGTQTADGARTAPFTYFEQLRQTNGVTITTDGIQFGQDREHTDRLFQGKWCDVMVFSAALTADEVSALKLYGDLKFRLYRLIGSTLTFPVPAMLGLPGYEYFFAPPKPWEDVTNSHIYDDEGRSFNRTTDTPPREWQLRINCNASSHAESKLLTDVYDAFWDEVGIDGTFSFTDKYGETHTGVRVKSYSRSHEAHRSWLQPVAFTLVKYP